MSGRNRGLVPRELPLDLSLGESDICHSTETTKPVRSNRTYMSNILNTAFSAEEMDFQLEGALRSLTMDQTSTENQPDGSETRSLTTVPERDKYSEAYSIGIKNGVVTKLTTKETTINRLL